MYHVFFYLSSSLAIFFGLALIFFKNPLYSILSLVCCVFFSVIILFMCGIEFMSFVYMVVYIGAIAVLFLFIIMMLNLNSLNGLSTCSSTYGFFLYCCIFFKCLFFIFLVNNNLFLFYCGYLKKNILIISYQTTNPDYSGFLLSLEKCLDISPLLSLNGFRYDYPTFFVIIMICHLWYSFTLNKVNFNTIEKIDLQKNPSDSIADHIFSGLDSFSELANFCFLYNIYPLYFILAGFILLFALLGAISLCLSK